jgi:hypothetical protein
VSVNYRSMHVVKLSFDVLGLTFNNN